MMDKDYDDFFCKGELLTFVGETEQFYLSDKHRCHSSCGPISLRRFSVKKGSMVALTRNYLLEIKKSEEKNLTGLPSFPELLH